MAMLVAAVQPTFGQAGASSANTLTLDVQPASWFVQPGEPVIVEMNVSNLAQMVNGCQALIGYSSTYLFAPHSVVAGGGYWSELIYEDWTVPGELDTAIGIQLEGGPAGTDADSTVAFITLTAGATEGTTSIVFRSDFDDKYATMLSDLNAEPVWPNKVDSREIVIDGTPPAVQIVHATQTGNELLTSLGSTKHAIQGTVAIQVTASDSLAGLAATPVLTVKDSADNSLTATFVDESPAGTFNYTAAIAASAANGLATISATATDNAGHITTTTDTFEVNKNQITGSIEFQTLSTRTYSVDRSVTFTATNSAGTVLAQWSTLVTFVNNPTTRVASGTFLLTDVPQDTARLSAKTAWTLRRRLPISWDSQNQATGDFTVVAGKDLLGGDINGNNIVNLVDYSTMKAHWNAFFATADVNGDGPVQTLDYAIMKSNWLTMGDPP
jgi:predicted secreted protein